jgi:hypothetical protein
MLIDKTRVSRCELHRQTNSSDSIDLNDVARPAAGPPSARELAENREEVWRSDIIAVRAPQFFIVKKVGDHSATGHLVKHVKIF